MVGAMTYGAEVTRLGAISHGAEFYDSISRGSRRGDGVDHLGAIDPSAELGFAWVLELHGLLLAFGCASDTV